MTPPGTPPATTRGPARFRAPEDLQEPRSTGRAVAAGLALLVLVVGVPVALWIWTGPPPIPTKPPGPDDLTQQVGTDTVFVILRAVVWLAWLQFVVSVVVEAASAVRGRGLPRHLPLSGFSQQLARTLVSAVLVSGVVASGASAASAAPTTAAPEASGTQAVAVQTTDDAVATSETPTSIPDEAVRASADEGQVRVSHAGVPSTMTDVIGKKVYIVAPPKGHYHDNLWDIAERHLGDGRRWRQIYSLNDGREQPDGRQLVVGKLIQPGWVLIMPDDATGLERVKEMPATPQQAPAPTQAPVDEPAEEQAGSGDRVEDATVSASSRLQPDLLGGGLLAAGLLGALAAERRRRRSRPAEPAAVEAEVALRAGADPERATRLDRALRGLSALCRAQQHPLPSAYAALVDDTGVELLLAPARPDAPAPWVPVDEGRRWRLPREDQEPGDLGHAPFPGLVCVGRDDAGRDVLVDLESLGGIVSVSGDDRIAHEVVSAVAVQLATSPWSDAQQVTGHHLAGVLSEVAGERLSLVDDVTPLLDEVARTRPQRATDEVLSGRLARRPGVVPVYLALGSEPGPDELERLLELTSAGARGFGVVSVGSLPGTALHVDEAGILTVPLLDLRVEAVRLSDRSAGAVAELFSAARTEAPTTPEERVRVAAPARAGDDAHWSHADVRVGVLGPAEVRTAGALDPTRTALATEIAVFLALQPGPVHPSVLAASVWPRGVTPEVRDATIERVREWLGADVDGNHRLRADEDGRVSLDASVAVDWSAFGELALRAQRAGNTREEAELLRRGLHLVRGGFVEGRPSGRYSWLARTHLEEHVPAVVADAAHRLTQLCRDDGDPAGAAAAAEAGLRIAAADQVLWRDLVRACFEQDGADGAAEAAGRMADELSALGVPVEAETEALVEELLPRGSSLSG